MRYFFLIIVLVISLFILKVSVLLIAIAFAILIIIILKILSMLRRRYWLYKHNFVKLLRMPQIGSAFVPWDDVLNPSNSKIIEVSDVKNHLNKNYKFDDFLYDKYLNEINNLSNNKSLVVVEFRSPWYTWRNKCGIGGYLFFDPKRKEQLNFIQTVRN